MLVPKSPVTSQLFQLDWALEICKHAAVSFLVSADFGLHYKDQDSEFLFVFASCYFLGLRNSAEEKSLILLFLIT